MEGREKLTREPRHTLSERESDGDRGRDKYREIQKDRWREIVRYRKTERVR